MVRLLKRSGQYLSVIFFLSTSQVIAYASGPKVLIGPFHQVKAAPNRVQNRSFRPLEVQRLTLHEVSVKTRARQFGGGTFLQVIPLSYCGYPSPLVDVSQKEHGQSLLAMDYGVMLFAVAVSGVPRDGSRVHTHDHDGSEAPDESIDIILSSEPKPLGKHMPPPPPSILSLRESSYPP
ncbi:hypothetical protein Tco_0525397 [Tanacetum coccineum]